MRLTKLKFAALAVLLITGMAAAVPAFAHGDEDQGTTAPPGTVTAIWQAIDQKAAELRQLVQSGPLANVHHVAFALRDLVAALPAHSTNLAADRQAAIKSDVKFVATLAGRLDASGDANDRPGAQSEYDKLARVLSHLRSNYAK